MSAFGLTRAVLLASAALRADCLALGAAAPALQAYAQSLALYPLETKIVTAAALAVAGDALAQLRECEPYDKRRATGFVLFDTCYRGGFQHAMFPLISATFSGNALHGALPAIPLDVCSAVTRTAVNQLGVVPVIYYPLFFIVTGAVQGLNFNAGLRRAREKFWPLMSRNLLFWVPVQYSQFAFVPVEWQVPYICVAGLVWNVILSAIAGRVECEVPEEMDEMLATPEPRLQGVVEPMALRREALPAEEGLQPRSLDGGRPARS